MLNKVRVRKHESVYDNASEFAESVATFAHCLQMMRYNTSLSGKMHFVLQDQLHGFDDRVPLSVRHFMIAH